MQVVDTPVVNFASGRQGNKIKAVVVHITEGSSASALSWFNNPVSQASAHYLVDEAGLIHRLVKEEDTAWHAGKVVLPTWPGLVAGINPNLYTIGIETALLSASQFPAWKQWKAWAELVRDICLRYGIPQTNIGIVHHNEIRGDKACPGFWINRRWLPFL